MSARSIPIDESGWCRKVSQTIGGVCEAYFAEHRP